VCADFGTDFALPRRFALSLQNFLQFFEFSLFCRFFWWSGSSIVSIIESEAGFVTQSALEESNTRHPEEFKDSKS
jgi:hypothetical protein